MNIWIFAKVIYGEAISIFREMGVMGILHEMA